MWVRFLPSGYIAPHRIAHDLTSRQREVLHIVAKSGPIPLREILEKLTDSPASSTVRDDLYLLKQLKLLDTKGHGRGATWVLALDSED